MSTDAKADIVAYVSENPIAAFTDEASYSQFYEKVKSEVMSHVPDLTTEKGRKEIASLAYKVTRSKTAIDAAGKKLNEDARAQINKVDAQRRKIRDELDALADDVRRPLTEWENAEKEREMEAEKQLSEIADLAAVVPSDTAASIKARFDKLKHFVIRDDVHLGKTNEVFAYFEKTLAEVELAYERAAKYESDQAELARLRAEQEERDRVEREAREKAEAEQREKERREREAAEQKAREEAAAQRARDEEHRKAQEAIKKAEAEARAIREKAERAERERQEAIERARREEEARAADREHRGKIMKAAKEAIMAAADISDDAAKKVVLAVAASEIPHISIRF